MTVFKNPEFRRLGEFLSVFWSLIPVLVFNPSVNAKPGLWQEAQEIVLSKESRVSKNSSLPRAILAESVGLSFGEGMATYWFKSGSGLHIKKVAHIRSPKKRYKTPTEIGHREVLDIKPFGEIEAKFDTGNSAKAVIHADKMKVNDKKVTWTLLGKTITSNIIEKIN